MAEAVAAVRAGRRRRARERRKSNLRVLRPGDDDFAASVERDLAQLPTERAGQSPSTVTVVSTTVVFGRIRSAFSMFFASWWSETWSRTRWRPAGAPRPGR